jgi:hypothetical protein
MMHFCAVLFNKKTFLLHPLRTRPFRSEAGKEYLSQFKLVGRFLAGGFPQRWHAFGSPLKQAFPKTVCRGAQEVRRRRGKATG